MTAEELRKQVIAIIEIFDAEVVTAVAKAHARMLDALLVNGFTRAEAMQLLVATGIGKMSQ